MINKIVVPYYMIPAYYIKIDEVPLKPNGKMDRKALPKPDASNFQTDYIAPENETQKKLCEAMAKVLKFERFGINDDFYELGGDYMDGHARTEAVERDLKTAVSYFKKAMQYAAAVADSYYMERIQHKLDVFNEGIDN